MVRIGVVGGGAAGALCAIHGAGHAKVVVVEPRAELGRGVAYGTVHRHHVLNVRAGQLSAYPDDDGHFARWAGAEDTAYLPRGSYGAYLAACLPDVEHVRDHVVDLTPVRAGVALHLAGGRSVVVDRVALAVGPSPPGWPATFAPEQNESFVIDPWAPNALDALPSGAPILLVGTGLTAIDVALSLRAAGHREIVAVSRHGLLPSPHVPGPHLRPAYPLVEPATARRLVRWMRDNAADWRGAVDDIRAQTNDLWAELSDGERARLLRHVHRRWEVARHRMAPQVAAAVRRMQAAGELVVTAGCISAAARRGDLIQVDIGERRYRVGGLVNCTGPSLDVRRSTRPLIRTLLQRGIAHPGPLNLGLDTDPMGCLPASDGKVLVVGALRRGRQWETTAIPEIRSQAVALARGRTTSPALA